MADFTGGVVGAAKSVVGTGTAYIGNKAKSGGDAVYAKTVRRVVNLKDSKLVRGDPAGTGSRLQSTPNTSNNT